MLFVLRCMVGWHACLHPRSPPCTDFCQPCSKHAIVVADKKLGNSCTIHETIRVKSAAWDDDGAPLFGRVTVWAGVCCTCNPTCCAGRQPVPTAAGDACLGDAFCPQFAP